MDENPWTTDIGPLPMWAWAGIALGGAVTVAYVRNRSAQASAATSTADQASAAQVPQFVNQTYVSTTPPSVPSSPVPQPAPGPTGPGPINAPPGNTPVPPKPVATLPAPTGIHSTGATSHSISVAWASVAGATSYRIRVTYQGKLVGSPRTTSGTSAVLDGLGPDHTYTVHVASVNSAGTGPESNGPAIKTSR